MHLSWKSWVLITALLIVPFFVPAAVHGGWLVPAAKSLGHIEY